MGRTTFYLLEQGQKEAVSRKGGKEARADVEKEEPESSEKSSLEEKLEEYHTGGGWYKLPGYEKAMRKNEAIEALKEG